MSKIDQLKDKFKVGEKCNLEDLKKYIESNFELKPNTKEGKIEFSINNRQSGEIIYKLDEEGDYQITEIDTDIYTGLALADINQHD